MLSYEDIFKNKQRVLFVMAHPDDVDVFFGGSICRLTDDNKEVRIIVVTNGGRGSRENDISENELAKAREQEQIKALSCYGVAKKNFSTLNYLDGTVENDMKLIGEISGIIRKFKPDMVCTHEPHGYYFQIAKQDKKRHFVNHRDHRMTGRSTLDAVYPFSRDISFFKDQIINGGAPTIISEVMFTFDREVNTKIDITDVADRKVKGLLCHKSQFDKEHVESIMGMFGEGEKYFEKGNYIKLAW